MNAYSVAVQFNRTERRNGKLDSTVSAAMDQEITIEETGPDFFLASLEQYLESAEFSDVVLISMEGDEMPAHRAILSSVSRFLRDIFVRDVPLQAGEGTIHLHLPETSTRDVYSFLQLAYCGFIELSVHRQTSLLSLLQILSVSEDIVIVGNENIEDISITLPAQNGNAEDQEEVAIPDVVESVKPSRNPLLGTCSLSKVKPDKCSSSCHKSNSGVTVEFLPSSNRAKTAQRAASTIRGPPSKLPKVVAGFPPPSPQPDPMALPHLEGFISDKTLADKKTREILDGSTIPNGTDPSRKFDRCQCPNCLFQLAANFTGGASWTNLHVCHYADCGKKYKKTSHLRAHLRWHVGDQPFVCTWQNCGKRFTRSDELHRHYRIHTGEKNHKCNVCAKCFSRSDHLKKHLMSHAAAGHTVPSIYHDRQHSIFTK